MEELLKALTNTLEKFELTSSEIKIYSLLLKEQLTPRQIAKKLDLSERIVREKLKHLLELGLVERELINRGWLGYLYKAKAPKEALNALLSKMEEFIKSFEKEANRML
ncbi:ArsR family transcriptional regulator [Thermococcus sp. M39]|uniref:helix-turn-helix domain-containing protein n=1 Tax=unclassified Thermococcus TaxID=2627626 RepID=UPI00143B61A7|nr:MULTISPECIES: helix-turn-helix domain-containing protein [unclassified Thermococcus]NJE08542.1 ArsR family transcriptional regulator [Thermococcus sp. M39]NJE13140.1 ArsR family transcriptional regulator [Thermococcus sp. LS2]